MKMEPSEKVNFHKGRKKDHHFPAKSFNSYDNNHLLVQGVNEETEKKAVDKEGDAVMVVWKVKHSHPNNDRGDLDGRGMFC